MVYLKRVNKKFDKYTKNKKERNYKKLKTSVLKNDTLNNISKNTKSQWEVTKKDCNIAIIWWK